MPDALGRMTHDERVALIYRPFFLTTFTRSYLWSGVITGGYVRPEAESGGMRASSKTNGSAAADGLLREQLDPTWDDNWEYRGLTRYEQIRRDVEAAMQTKGFEIVEVEEVEE